MKKRVAIPLAVVVGIIFWMVVFYNIGRNIEQKPKEARQEVSAEAELEPVTAIDDSTPQSAPEEPEIPPEAIVQSDKPEELVPLYEPIDPARTDIDNQLAKYALAPIEPGHFGNTKRYTQRVVVYQRLNKDQLTRLADLIYQEAKGKTPFNALQIAFYDYEQLLLSSARFGYVNYAPNGKWADANKVKTGDYAKMKPDIHLVEPDWTNVLTEREAEICAYYIALEREYINKDIDNPGVKAQTETGKQYGMTPEAVFQLIMKYSRGYGAF